MLSVLAIAKSVPLFLKFANGCRCWLEEKQGLKRMWVPSSDRRGRGPVFRNFGKGLGVTQELPGSSGVVSSDYPEDVTRSSTFPPGLCVLPDVKQHRKNGDILIIFPLCSKWKEEGRRGRQFTHPKKPTQKPFEVLK